MGGEFVENKIAINKNTTIPLFETLTAILVLIGGIFWLSSVATAAFSSEKRLDKIEEAIVQMKNDLTYLRVREEIREKGN